MEMATQEVVFMLGIIASQVIMTTILILIWMKIVNLQTAQEAAEQPAKGRRHRDGIRNAPRNGDPTGSEEGNGQNMAEEIPRFSVGDIRRDRYAAWRSRLPRGRGGGMEDGARTSQ
jgi:hypothetical protein